MGRQPDRISVLQTDMSIGIVIQFVPILGTSCRKNACGNVMHCRVYLAQQLCSLLNICLHFPPLKSVYCSGFSTYVIILYSVHLVKLIFPSKAILQLFSCSFCCPKILYYINSPVSSCCLRQLPATPQLAHGLSSSVEP